jgi:predicted neuraminidase
MEIRLLSGLIATDFAVDGIDTKDYPDFCDAYIMEASVYQNGTWREATEDELDELNEDSDLVYKCVEDYLF